MAHYKFVFTWRTLWGALVIFFLAVTLWASSTFAPPADARTCVFSSVNAPLPPLPPSFSLKLDVRNTAYQFILTGPEARQLLAVTAALQLRAVDAERDILVVAPAPLTEPLMEVLEQLRATVVQVPFEEAQQMERDFNTCCDQFYGCWMKLLTWRAPYRAVMNLDTDFLVLRNMSAAFELMAAGARGPFDVGGVPDPVVAATQPDADGVHDVFNGGMFIALPSEEAYGRLFAHARGSRCMWGEMLWLNTFAATHGRWVRLPPNFNLFPSLLGPASPYLAYAPPNWNNIAGLHFAGASKVWPHNTREDCLQRAELDCLECCIKWAEATARLRALLAANAALSRAAAGGGGGDIEAAAAAERAAEGLLPPGWAGTAVAVVRRNAARGFTFDKEAYHDGETGGTFGAREREKRAEYDAAPQEDKNRWGELVAAMEDAPRRAWENGNNAMREQQAKKRHENMLRIEIERARVSEALRG